MKRRAGKSRNRRCSSYQIGKTRLYGVSSKQYDSVSLSISANLDSDRLFKQPAKEEGHFWDCQTAQRTRGNPELEHAAEAGRLVVPDSTERAARGVG